VIGALSTKNPNNATHSLHPANPVHPVKKHPVSSFEFLLTFPLILQFQTAILNSNVVRLPANDNEQHYTLAKNEF
jgi:hypothetical protein